MAAILVEEADISRLFRILEEILNKPVLSINDYDLEYYNYFKLKYSDLAELKKSSRLWYQAYKTMTNENEKKSCYKQYSYYKKQCEDIEEQVESIKNRYNFY